MRAGLERRVAARASCWSTIHSNARSISSKRSGSRSSTPSSSTTASIVARLSAVGSFLALIPAPLGLGSIELEDGRTVHGFLCEAHALRAARDISHFGGWRSYVQSKQTLSPQSV